MQRRQRPIKRIGERRKDAEGQKSNSTRRKKCFKIEMNAFVATGEQIINGERRRRNYLGHGLERTIKCGHEDTLPGTTSGGTMKEIQDTITKRPEGR